MLLKTKVTITIDGDLLNKLKIIAEKNNRPLSQYMNLLLISHIARLDAKKAKEQEREKS